MSSLVSVAIHSSQLPGAVRLDLLESLRSRRVNHKFHYDSLKQTQKWLALHQAYSPSRTDADCASAYHQGFAATVQKLSPAGVHLIGLGCGGGQKDAGLLKLLRDSGRKVFYTPSDVSVAMVLVSRQTALTVMPDVTCSPLVCDLATAQDLSEVLERTPTGPASDGGEASLLTRLFTFFGMIPNFEPEIILPRLASLVGVGDYLLFSANLAPGSDYAAGVRRVLAQYDNELTRDWLLTFLLDLGVEKTDGVLRFVIEDSGERLGLKRIAAYFKFTHRRSVRVDSESFEFEPGESLRLFFSYRHTPALVRALLAEHGLEVVDHWIPPSEEEGVFLVLRAGSERA